MIFCDIAHRGNMSKLGDGSTFVLGKTIIIRIVVEVSVRLRTFCCWKFCKNIAGKTHTLLASRNFLGILHRNACTHYKYALQGDK